MLGFRGYGHRGYALCVLVLFFFTGLLVTARVRAPPTLSSRHQGFVDPVGTMKKELSSL